MDTVPKGADSTTTGAPTEVSAVKVSMDFLFVLHALVSEGTSVLVLAGHQILIV